jgi:cytochrome c biogenesis protein CcdA
MERENDNHPSIPSIMRTIFGIIMIIVYVGMGILLLINFFDWTDGVFYYLRIGGGILFIVYGIWRAIRQFRGYDTPL